MTITALHRPLPTQYEVRGGHIFFWTECTCGWRSRSYSTVETARMPLGNHVRTAR